MNCRDNLLEKAFKEAITQAQRYANPPWCDIFTQSRRLENVEMLLETLCATLLLPRVAAFCFKFYAADIFVSDNKLK